MCPRHSTFTVYKKLTFSNLKVKLVSQPRRILFLFVPNTTHPAILRLNLKVKLVEKSLAEAAAGAASTMLARQQRNGRRYDVPQIGEYHHHQQSEQDFWRMGMHKCNLRLFWLYVKKTAPILIYICCRSYRKTSKVLTHGHCIAVATVIKRMSRRQRGGNEFIRTHLILQ